jgi:flagellin-like protein
MQLKHICGDADERAVSPVVGVAILVGITVILASIVGAFVFGLVNIGEAPPDAQFTFQQQNVNYSAEPGNGNGQLSTMDGAMPTVRIVHNSGEAVSEQQLDVKVSGNETDPSNNASVYTVDYRGDEVDDRWSELLSNRSAVLAPGDSFRVEFYGVNKKHLSGGSGRFTIQDYNVTRWNAAGSSRNPPTDKVAFDGEDSSSAAVGLKIGNCDQIQVVWTASSGAQGQVLQSYQVPGKSCT